MSFLLMQAPAFPVLVDVPSAELRELVMPMFTPFQLLITPCTALGAGSQLKSMHTQSMHPCACSSCLRSKSLLMGL